MGTINVTIVFEVDDSYTTHVDLSADDFLHEALCKAIHEFDPEALEDLATYVINIVHPVLQK